MLDGEKQLIKRAIRGEALAFGLLYDRYQTQIYRFIYLKVSHREEAEDLTHQVFLKSWQNIGEYKFQGFPFSSWLYRIARNQIIDYYRVKKNNSNIEEISESKIDDSSIEIIEIIDNNLDVKKIKEAIKQLNPGHQDVIILRFIEELTLKETASALKKSEIAVKLLQHRAIKKLKKILNNNE